MADNTAPQKFPDTIAPQDMRTGKRYLLAIRQNVASPFEIVGPFTINDKPKRHKNGLFATHYKVRARIQGDNDEHDITLPLAGHASIHSIKMSLHAYSEDVKNYFLCSNKNIGVNKNETD